MTSASRTDRPPRESLPGVGKPARRSRARSSLIARGEPMMWLTGGALVICLAMIVGILALIFVQGVTTFWPRPVPRFDLKNGRVLMGEVARHEHSAPAHQGADNKTPLMLNTLPTADATPQRRLVRTGNFDLTNTHFDWIDDRDIAREERLPWAIVVERRAWGRFYGIPNRFIQDGEVIASSPEDTWAAFRAHHAEVGKRFARIRHLQEFEAGRLHARIENTRLSLRDVAMKAGIDSKQYRTAAQEFEHEMKELEEKQARLSEEILSLRGENDRLKMVMATADGRETTLDLDNIVRAYAPNQLGIGGKLSVYVSRWREFLFDDPREANSEGGVWPAIVGTVVMTLLMSLVVVPFGVLAALYLREYAKDGPLVSVVRIAVNNLAGVPSIVFGVFGLGFFCYIVGASLDELLFANRLPNPTYGKGGLLWASLTLALLTLPVVIVATEEALAAVPSSMRQGSYACGASKWQTIRRIVLPRAMPGIMTGLILAMARGAGEVAPLMLVGAVKLAPALPFDSIAPYLHPDRSFMHLGFHIYDVGFQSQNSEAAKPMVFTTTLLLIALIASLNIVAVRIRTRLRKKFGTGQF